MLAALLTSSFAFIDAQEPASTPATSPSPALALPPNAAAPVPGQTPGSSLEGPQPLPLLPLIPQSLPTPAQPRQPAAAPSEKAGGKGAAAKAKPGATPTPVPLTAEQLRNNIRLRELTTQVLREDAAVREMWQTADLAKTYEGRRTALRDYYTLLYTKIEKLDPALHDMIEQILYTRLFSLEQHRVRPSPLLEPIPVLPGSHSSEHLSGRPANMPLPAPAATPVPAAQPGENRSFLEMQ
jgi:hypothetical protein